MSVHLVPVPAAFVPFARRDLEGSIPARFERVAAQAPDRIAVRMGTSALTYGALSAAADRAASAIGAVMGEAPAPVALMLPQGVPLVVAILGVLKAGHFYVPLDVSHPDDALRAVLVDSGARAVATDAARLSNAGRLAPALPAVDIADLPAAEGVGRRAVADDLAYLFYTSGSTGRPKGVADTHRNVPHNVMRYTNALYFSADDTLTLLQSPAFSGAVSSLFGVILNGATVSLYDVGRDRGWLLLLERRAASGS